MSKRGNPRNRRRVSDRGKSRLVVVIIQEARQARRISPTQILLGGLGLFVAGILTMAGGRLFDYLVTTTSTGSIASASEGHFLEFVVACIMSAIAVYFCMAGMFGFSPFRRATHALRRSPNANAIKKKTKSPKNDQADRDTLEAGDVFQVDLRVSWYLGEEERGHKYWGFVMKVESDKLVIEKITKGS